MTTILEIQKPHLTYCKEHEIYCVCPKCKVIRCFYHNVCKTFKTCDINKCYVETEPPDNILTCRKAPQLDVPYNHNKPNIEL